MALQLDYVAHSEIGLVRKNNQDSGYVSPNILVVADGMGGAAAGDLASAVAVALVRKADRRVTGHDMLEVLAGAINQANDKIADLAADDHTLEGMGTTVSAAMFDGSQLGLVHIGDSRAYLYREGELRRLTHDHSWVQSLVDEGKISETEASYHPHRSLLLKVLNGQASNEPDSTLLPVRAGDRLLFCSDGLCGLVDDDEIADALAGSGLENVLEELIAAAHREGGIDNITIILADVVEDDEDGTLPPRVIGAAAERQIPPLRDRVSASEHTQPIPRTESTPRGMSSRLRRRGNAATKDDEEETRYALRIPPRRRLLRPVLVGLLVLGLVAAGLGVGYGWSRTQYYVGPKDAQVAIYRGLPERVLGAALSSVYEVQPIILDDLPPYYLQRVTQTITTNGLDDARNTTAELKLKAENCVRQRQARLAPPLSTQGATPTPLASPTPAAGAIPGASPTAPPGAPPAGPGALAPPPASTLAANPSLSAVPPVAASASPSAEGSPAAEPGPDEERC